MGTFPGGIQRSQRGLTASSGNVRAGFDPSTGAGAVGQAVAGLGLEGAKVIKDRQREQAIKDQKLSILNSKTELTQGKLQSSNAEREFFDKLSVNDDVSTYGTEINTLFGTLDSLTPKDPAAAAAYGSLLATKKLTIAREVRDAKEVKIKDLSKKADFLLLQTAKDSGELKDFTEYKAAIISGVKLDAYTPEQGEALLDDADKEIKQAHKNTVLGLASSQRGEDGMIDTKAADEEIEASGLDVNDQVDLKNQIENEHNREIKRSNEQFADRTGEEDARLNELLLNTQLTDQEIDLVDLGAVGDQKTVEKNFKANWKKDLHKINALSEPGVSNESIYDSLVAGSASVERGALPPAEWETSFRNAWANGDLEKEDRRSLRSKDIVATKTMQNRAFLAQTDGASDARFSLVESSEDQIAKFTTARDLSAKNKDFKGAEALNKAIQKNQIQRWNFGRYRNSLRTQMSQNEDWSQEQIFVASDILKEEFNKDFDVLVKEFDAANPSKAITNTPPDAEFKDVWEKLSVDDKAKIWELRMLGESVDSIIGEL
jgi:hypothetical protein